MFGYIAMALAVPAMIEFLRKAGSELLGWLWVFIWPVAFVVMGLIWKDWLAAFWNGALAAGLIALVATFVVSRGVTYSRPARSRSEPLTPQQFLERLGLPDREWWVPSDLTINPDDPDKSKIYVDPTALQEVISQEDLDHDGKIGY